MILDNDISLAVSRIRQRAERQADLQKLIDSYVDSGIVPQLYNENHQILYGRRGTGKTHVFQVLRDNFEKDQFCVAYIDCRTLGSSSQFTDRDLPIGRRCLSLFRDFLSPVHNELIEQIIERQPENGEKALDLADEFLRIITEPITTYHTKEIEISKSSESEDKNATGIELKPFKKDLITLNGKYSRSYRTGNSKLDRISVTTEDKIIFPAIHYFLSECLKQSGIHLVILLDEWSSLPRDIQPYFAEFIKRGVLPVSEATLKIAALEQRSSFSKIENNDIIGFEVGADISMTQDLDDSYVYDRNPDMIAQFYSNIIFRHLQLDLPDGYLQNNFKITSGKVLSSKLFTGKNTFHELSRAAEGVIRDLINIFTIAFFHAKKRNRSTIDKKAIIESARQWFEQDKSQHLDADMQSSLRKIIEEVIGRRNARSFLLPRELEKHPMVLKLFDARVIHHMQRGYADKDNPGVRYNIYNLDYGSYVDLIGTSKEPEIELRTVGDIHSIDDIVVPFDDKRSIRRIVLTKDVLEDKRQLPLFK